MKWFGSTLAGTVFLALAFCGVAEAETKTTTKKNSDGSTTTTTVEMDDGWERGADEGHYKESEVTKDKDGNVTKTKTKEKHRWKNGDEEETETDEWTDGDSSYSSTKKTEKHKGWEPPEEREEFTERWTEGDRTTFRRITKRRVWRNGRWEEWSRTLVNVSVGGRLISSESTTVDKHGREVTTKSRLDENGILIREPDIIKDPHSTGGGAPKPKPKPKPKPEPDLPDIEASLGPPGGILALAPAPEGSEILLPDVAFPGGTLTGVVLSPEGEPVVGAPVEIATLSGTVYSEPTDEEGQFTADVPRGGEEALSVVVAGVLKATEVALARRVPRDLSSRPPTFVQPGSAISVRGNYPEVALEAPSDLPVGIHSSGRDAATEVAIETESPGSARVESGRVAPDADPPAISAGESIPAPVARAVSADGTQAVTKYHIPNNVRTGAFRTVLVDPEGNRRSFETGVYRVVDARIDQERLRGGQQAEFSYRFDFGPGAERIVQLRINTEGPIKVVGEGDTTRLHVNADGSAVFVGQLRARKVTPGSARPFTITPVITSEH